MLGVSINKMGRNGISMTMLQRSAGYENTFCGNITVNYEAYPEFIKRLAPDFTIYCLSVEEVEELKDLEND